MTLTTSDVRSLLNDREAAIFTCYGEASNQPLEGQVGVLWVIANRCRRQHLAPIDICFAPKQFSCWNDDGSANHARLVGAVQLYLDTRRVFDGRPMQKQIAALAPLVLDGTLLDNTHNSTHYCTRALFQARPPNWAAGKLPAAALGDHVFFNNVA